jgi:hypothetical protein
MLDKLSDYHFYLLPSLLRAENGIDLENKLFSEFKKFSEKLLRERKSEWETLFNMQHYYIPTRLLDWSETFGIALFFAAYYNYIRDIDVSAAIYLLNPTKLNMLSHRNNICRIPEEESKFPYREIYINHTPFAATSPIAIEPNFINDRMLAQRGVFTVYDDSKNAIEDEYPDVVKKVELPKKAIQSALEFLDMANINAYTVYPDLSGVADFLNKSVGLIYK